MDQVIPNLYVGGDTDYEKVEDRSGWSFLRCCKFGPGGHKDTLGYTTNAAPKGPDYLAATAQRGHRMALNFIDVEDPNLIPQKMIEQGLQFIEKRREAGDKVLVACNRGHSRGPTTALLYLRAIGEMPGNFITAERIYRTLYPKYNPAQGARQFSRSHWDFFKDYLRPNG
jgi:hypothetical protein